MDWVPQQAVDTVRALLGNLLYGVRLSRSKKAIYREAYEGVTQFLTLFPSKYRHLNYINFLFITSVSKTFKANPTGLNP